MKKLWNRQSKLNKFIAFCLAVVLAVVPLMTYVGDKKGAKAENGSSTVEYYTEVVEEEIGDNGYGHYVYYDDISSLYYIDFGGNKYEEKTLSYYADTLNFSVKAEILAGLPHEYRDSIDAVECNLTFKDDYEIIYIYDGAAVEYDYYKETLDDNKKIATVNEYIGVDSATYTNGIAVYIKPKVDSYTGISYAFNDSSIGYTLIGVYKFEKVSAPSVYWYGSANNGVASKVTSSSTRYKAAYMEASPTISNEVTGEWRYAYIYNNTGTAPSDTQIKAAAWNKDSFGTLDSSNIDKDGFYYGYLGYFGKDENGDYQLLKYYGTNTPVNLDVTAPSVTDFKVYYKAEGSTSWTEITGGSLDGNVFLVGSGDTFKMSFTVGDNYDNIEAVEYINANTDTFTRRQNDFSTEYTSNEFGADKITNQSKLGIKVTDKVGNEIVAYFMPGLNEVKFHKVASKLDIESVKIVGENDTSGNNAIAFGNNNVYINKAWLTENGTPAIKVNIKSSDKITYKTSTPQSAFEFELINVVEGGLAASKKEVYSRPYYTTDITAKLSDVSKKYERINYEYIDASGSRRSGIYGQIICDYEAPEIVSAKLQQSTDSGATWTDVPADCINNGIYYINSAETTMYRYYINATDSGESGLDTVECTSGGYTFTSNSNGEYICNINVADIPSNVASAPLVEVTVSDKAGNKTVCSTLPRVIKKSASTKATLVLKDGGETVDLSAPGTYTTNNKLALTVNAESGNKITDVTFTADVNGVSYAFTATQVTNTGIMNPVKKIYEVTYKFEIPEGVDVNSLIENGWVVVATDGINNNKTISLNTLLYDVSDPVFKAVMGSAEVILDQLNTGWVQSYDLSYKILSGEQNTESKIASASYFIDNTSNTITQNVVINGSASLVGSIEVPESSSVAGTRVGMQACDEAGNAASDEVFIKVDATRPVIGDIAVEGYEVHSIPVLGCPNISTVISDNLTLQSAEMKITYPDGTVKTATLSAVEETGLIRNLSYKLEDGAMDGDYKVEVSACDMAGNVAYNQVKTFKLDNTKPVVTAAIASGTAGGKALRADGTDMYYRSDVGLSFTCSDENIRNIVVTDNDTVIDVVWNDAVGAVNISSEGRHVIKINAVDKSGNTADEKQLEFIIDKSAPQISLALNGLPYYEANGMVDCLGSSTVGISVSDMTVDADDLYYQVSVTRPDEPTTTSQFLKTDGRSFTFNDEGEYTVSFYTLDMANNLSDTRSVSFRIDKTAPDVSITGISGGGTSANAANVSFVLKEAFWKDASGVITIYRKAGDGSEETLYKTINVTPKAYETVTTESLTETGVYRMEFTAADRVGHKSSVNQTFTIDREAPVVTLTGVDNYDVTDKTVEFKAEIKDDFYSTKTVSIEGTRTGIDGKKINLSFSSYNQHGNPTVISESYSEDGIYDIMVTAKDAAGNNHTSSVHFTIDKSAPVITGVDDLDGRILTAVDLDFDLDELVTDLTVCEIHMYLNGSEYDGSSDIPDGSYTLLITAEDELGNYTEKSVSFVLDTKAPVFIVTGVEDGEVKEESYSIDVSLQLDEDKLTEVTLNGKQIDIKDDMAHIDVAEEGEYTLYMKAVDVAGNEAEQTIEFKYGKEVNVMLIVIAVAVVLLATGGITAFAVIRKKKK